MIDKDKENHCQNNTTLVHKAKYLFDVGQTSKILKELIFKMSSYMNLPSITTRDNEFQAKVADMSDSSHLEF